MIGVATAPTAWCTPTAVVPASPAAQVRVPRPRRQTPQQRIRDDRAWQTAAARAFQSPVPRSAD